MNCRIVTIANIPEAAEMLKYSFEELGIPTVIEDDANLSPKVFHIDVYIRALRPHRVDLAVSNCKVLFQTEELWNRRETGIYDLSNRYDRVLEMYDENVKIPRGTENVVYCPVGYTPSYSMNYPEPEERDIDILFWGALTERRQEILNEVCCKFYDKHIVASSSLYGKAREIAIMRSKIVLNIKAHNMWSFGPIHILPAIANSRFVLAEKANGGYGPFVPDRHFKEYETVDELLDSISYWLNNDNERETFEKEAMELVKNECYFTPILKNAMRGII